MEQCMMLNADVRKGGWSNADTCGQRGMKRGHFCGRPLKDACKKGPIFLLPSSCMQVSASDHPLPSFRTFTFSIIHSSMVRQCNNWWSQNTLGFALIIWVFYPNPSEREAGFNSKASISVKHALFS